MAMLFQPFILQLMAFAGFNITDGQANGVVPQLLMLTGTLYYF